MIFIPLINMAVVYFNNQLCALSRTFGTFLNFRKICLIAYKICILTEYLGCTIESSKRGISFTNQIINFRAIPVLVWKIRYARKWLQFIFF